MMSRKLPIWPIVAQGGTLGRLDPRLFTRVLTKKTRSAMMTSSREKNDVFDLHFHSAASDGLASLDVLRTVLAKSRLAGYALTDHDHLASSVELADNYERAWIGAELAVEVGRFRIDVLALGVRGDDPALNDYLARRRIERQRRFELFGQLLREQGLVFDAPQNIYEKPQLAQPHVVAELRRHEANAERLQQIGAADDDGPIYSRLLQPLGQQIRSLVEPAMLGPRAAFDLIHQAGGLACLAHPVFKPYEEGIERAHELIGEWVSAGLDAIEVIHPAQEEEVQVELLGLVAEHDLLVGVGSDDHSAKGEFIGSQLAYEDPRAPVWWAAWEAARDRYR